MDIVATTILNELKRIEGMDSAIIAGGACRDFVLGGEFKDVDIFVKTSRKNELFFILNNNILKNPNFKVISHGGSKYDEGNRFLYKWDLKYLKTVDVQVVSYGSSLEELITNFDYDINKIYFDSEKGMVESPDFAADRDRGTATLSNLSNLNNLERAMDRFFRLKSKYPYLRFRSSCLELTNKKEESNKKEKTASGIYQETLNRVFRERLEPPVIVRDRNPAGRVGPDFF